MIRDERNNKKIKQVHVSIKPKQRKNDDIQTWKKIPCKYKRPDYHEIMRYACKEIMK